MAVTINEPARLALLPELPDLTFYETRVISAQSNGTQWHLQEHEKDQLAAVFEAAGWEKDPVVSGGSLSLRREILHDEHPETFPDHSPEVPFSQANDPGWLDWYPMGPGIQCVLCLKRPDPGVDSLRRCTHCREATEVRKALIDTHPDGGPGFACVVCGQGSDNPGGVCDRLRCQQVWALETFWSKFRHASRGGMPETVRAMLDRYPALVNDFRSNVGSTSLPLLGLELASLSAALLESGDYEGVPEGVPDHSENPGWAGEGWADDSNEPDGTP